MNYRIRRGEQEFGPYTLAELQQYVQSGHVVETDLAQSEGMSDWVPVSQILGNIPASPVAAYGEVPLGTPAERVPELVSLPPNWHWGIILALEVVTRAMFGLVWSLVQANWASKLIGKNTPLVLVAMYPAGVIAGMVSVLFAGGNDSSLLSGIGGVLIFAGLICRIVGMFKIRNAMEFYYNSVENIGLSMSGAMIFFFGTIYVQYHVNRIARMKNDALLSRPV